MLTDDSRILESHVHYIIRVSNDEIKETTKSNISQDSPSYDYSADSFPRPGEVKFATFCLRNVALSITAFRYLELQKRVDRMGSKVSLHPTTLLLSEGR